MKIIESSIGRYLFFIDYLYIKASIRTLVAFGGKHANKQNLASGCLIYKSQHSTNHVKGEIVNRLEGKQCFSPGVPLTTYIYLYHPLCLLSRQVPGSTTALHHLLSVVSPRWLSTLKFENGWCLSVPSSSSGIGFVTLAI